MYIYKWDFTRKDLGNIKYYDDYTFHKYVYDLFEKEENPTSRILYVVKEPDYQTKTILIITDRLPRKEVPFGKMEHKEIPENFLNNDYYYFEVKINPVKRDNKTGKIIPIKGMNNLIEWFYQKSESWGFKVQPNTLEIIKERIARFPKKGNEVCIFQVDFAGVLQVTDREKFINSFKNGIGKARGFGCGLLQVRLIRKE